MRVCPACGREVTEDLAVFCPFCASSLNPAPGPPTTKRRPRSLVVPVGLAIVGAVATALVVLLFLTRDKGSESASPPTPTRSSPDRVELRVAKTATNVVVLAWTWPTGLQVDSFTVERDGVVIDSVSSSTRKYVDTSASPGTRYKYRVVAVSADAEVHSKNFSVKTPVPSLDRARLQGSLRITYTVTSSNLSNAHPGEPLGTYTWEFTPECPDRPCGGSWTINLKGGPAIGKFFYKPSGYTGKMSGVSLGSCGGVSNVNDSATLDIQVVKARVVAGVWLATSVEGSYREYFPPRSGCSEGFLRATVSGVVRLAGD